jgi:KUP system potassium uptake protein
VILLSILVAQVPEISVSERIEVIGFPHKFSRIKARYGFMQTPNVPEILALAAELSFQREPSRSRDGGRSSTYSCSGMRGQQRSFSGFRRIASSSWARKWNSKTGQLSRGLSANQRSAVPATAQLLDLAPVLLAWASTVVA